MPVGQAGKVIGHIPQIFDAGGIQRGEQAAPIVAELEHGVFGGHGCTSLSVVDALPAQIPDRDPRRFSLGKVGLHGPKQGVAVLPHPGPGLVSHVIGREQGIQVIAVAAWVDILRVEVHQMRRPHHKARALEYGQLKADVGHVVRSHCVGSLNLDEVYDSVLDLAEDIHPAEEAVAGECALEHELDGAVSHGFGGLCSRSRQIEHVPHEPAAGKVFARHLAQPITFPDEMQRHPIERVGQVLETLPIARHVAELRTLKIIGEA
jgi:hypothetical protein